MIEESALPAIAKPRKSRRPRLFRSQSYRRLRSSLDVFSKELEILAGTSGEPWVPIARGLLQEAERALDVNEPERGWQSFFAAQRIALHGLKPEQLTARSGLVLAESESKLGGWRKLAVQGLLAKAGTEPDVYALALALQTLHEHYTNEYEKLRSIRRQTRLLCVIALAALGALLTTALWFPTVGIDDPEFQRSVTVTLYGVLGAAISGVLSLANASEKRIPQLLLYLGATMARVSLGAAAAYVVFTFLRAEILPFDLKRPNAEWLVLALSFAAGFSERLLVRAVKVASG